MCSQACTEGYTHQWRWNGITGKAGTSQKGNLTLANQSYLSACLKNPHSSVLCSCIASTGQANVWRRHDGEGFEATVEVGFCTVAREVGHTTPQTRHTFVVDTYVHWLKRIHNLHWAAGHKSAACGGSWIMSTQAAASAEVPSKGGIKTQEAKQIRGTSKGQKKRSEGELVSEVTRCCTCLAAA